MKKIFALAFAMVTTVSMFAAVTTNFTLYLDTDSKEVTASAASGDSYAPFNALNSASYFANYSNPSNIGLYFQYSGGDFMELYAPELVNVPIVVVTSREAAANQSYSFYSELLANHTDEVTITDLRPAAPLTAPYTFNINTITGDDGYDFTLDEEAAYTEGQNCVIADRFVLNYNPAAYIASVTTNEDGWASFAYTEDVRLASPMGLRIYKGALDNSNPEAPVINLTQVTAIPAGAGVFVKGEPLTTYHFSATTAGALSNNDIVGCTADTDPAGISDAIYTLRNVGGVTALYHYEGTAAIPSGKAYLPIPVGSNPAPQRVRMVINETQGVENVVVADVKAEKFVENGQIFIKRGEAVYNMQGQIVK